VQGPVTIGTDPTAKGKILASEVTTSTSTLYVVGDLTVEDAVDATKIVATGNITFGTGPITVATASVIAVGDLIADTNSTEINLADADHAFGGIKGNGTSVIKTGTDGITVTGTVDKGKFATGAIFKGNVTFTGATEFAGTLTHSGASTYTFNGATTITGAITVDTGGLTIAGTGAVGLTAAPTVDTNKLLTISNTGGVTLDAGIAIAVANGLTVSGAGAKIIVPTGQKIAITSTGTAVFSNTASVTLGGVGDWTATKAITIAIDSTTGVNITSTEAASKFASSGTAPKITLAANTALGIGGTVTLDLAGTANGIAFNNATSTVVLKPGAIITGTTATTLEAKSGTADGSGIKLTATDGTNNMFTFATGVVTASGTVPGSSATLVLGKSEWASTAADNSAGVDSTAGTGTAGSITAAAGTTVTLAGDT
jgi:hypothetical protein